MLFTCSDFLLNSFLNFQWTIIDNFDSVNHKPHCTFLCLQTLSTASNFAIDRHKMRPCGPERALGGETCCAKKLSDGISVATVTVLYCRSPILLMFNILPFFYENPLLVPQFHFKRVRRWPIKVLTINFYSTYHVTGRFVLMSYNSSIYLQWYTKNWCSCIWGTFPIPPFPAKFFMVLH